MNCEKCGAPLENTAVFCSECGAPVTPSEQTPPMPEAAPISEPEAAPEITIAQALETPPEPVQPVFFQQPYAPQPPVSPAPAPQKAYQPRRKPHIALRIPMQILSFVLCVILAASLVATLVLADLNRMTSAGGIKQLITTMLDPLQAPAQIRPAAAPGARSADITIPEDVFTGDDPTGSLTDWVYDMLEEASGEPLSVSRQQLQSFMEKSTVTDFLAEKAAAYAEDYINGTENTTITAEEILDVLEENTALMEQEFGRDITAEHMEQLTAMVEQVVAENDIDSMIRQEVFAEVDKAIEESTAALGGLNRDQIMAIAQLLASDTTMWTAVGVCAVLMVLLCLLNFYNVPAGLTWSAVPCILIGGLFSIPIAIVQTMPDVLSQLMSEAAVMVPMLQSFVSVLAPIHYGLLILGLGLLVISIVWRIVRSIVENKRRLAAA